ncbi:Zinc metalloprotease [Frankliniella fusca]|uniref:Zinc metalloprotease n=1 Tax=Frankliniella fusca TaxID=407009 RepID=A0AAE1HCB8_9NEOP|nr:Zinc metalloprotease [Frankliniella fusca]
MIDDDDLTLRDMSISPSSQHSENVDPVLHDQEMHEEPLEEMLDPQEPLQLNMPLAVPPPGQRTPEFVQQSPPASPRVPPALVLDQEEPFLDLDALLGAHPPQAEDELHHEVPAVLHVQEEALDLDNPLAPRLPGQRTPEFVQQSPPASPRVLLPPALVLDQEEPFLDLDALLGAHPPQAEDELHHEVPAVLHVQEEFFDLDIPLAPPPPGQRTPEVVLHSPPPSPRVPSPPPSPQRGVGERESEDEDDPEPLQMLGADVEPEDVILLDDDDDGYEQPVEEVPGPARPRDDFQRVRDEQDAEFAAALAIDRERDRQRERQQADAERILQEQTAAEARLHAALTERRTQAAAALAQLPVVSPNDGYTVAFWLPDGARHVMTFGPNTPLATLRTAAEAQEAVPWGFRLLEARRGAVAGDGSVADFFGAARRVVVMVEDDDEVPPPGAATPPPPPPPPPRERQEDAMQGPVALPEADPPQAPAPAVEPQEAPAADRPPGVCSICLESNAQQWPSSYQFCHQPVAQRSLWETRLLLRGKSDHPFLSELEVLFMPCIVQRSSEPGGVWIARRCVDISFLDKR